MTNRNETQLIVQVARLYYDAGLNQQEIAKKLGTTRQNISRLLLAAKEEGIVKIVIYDPAQEDFGLKKELIETFSLRDVVLTSSEGLETELVRSQLGFAAANYLVNMNYDGNLMGIGWGRSLYEMVNALPRNRQIPIHILPLIGGISDISPYFQVNELARRIAEALGGTFRYIYVPAFTQDVTVLESLNRTREVEQYQQMWKNLNVAVVGIGYVEFQQMSSMFFADHISPSVLAQLEAHGAVGDICGRFFTAAGEPVNLCTGVISIALEQLKMIPEVIAVAGGQEKTMAILGALRGGYIKTLVTDTSTARLVLREHRERR